MTINHVIFDLDGTLLDSAPDIGIALDQTLKEWGLPAVGVDRTRLWIGNGVAKLLQRAFLFLKQTEMLRLKEKAIQQSFYGHYHAHLAQHSQLYPGVLDVLAQLKSLGLKISVCTNKPEQFSRRLLDHFQISEYCDALVGGDTLAVKKPDPQPLLEACRRVDSTPDRSLMVGDSLVDVVAAQKAGIEVVCVDYGYNQGVAIGEQFGGRVIQHFSQVLECVGRSGRITLKGEPT